MSAFNQWVARKDLFERARSVLESLKDVEFDDELIKDLTKAIVAVECAIAKKSQSQSLRIKPFFFKWLKQNCALSDVQVSDEVYHRLSDDGKFKVHEENGVYTLASCRHSLSYEDELTKHLTSDERLQNTLFQEECVRRWLTAAKDFRASCYDTFQGSSSREHKNEETQNSNQAKDEELISTINANSLGITESKWSAFLGNAGMGFLLKVKARHEVKARTQSVIDAREKEKAGKVAFQMFVKKKEKERKQSIKSDKKGEITKPIRRQSDIAYTHWRSTKEMAEVALNILANIDRPTRKENNAISRCIAVGQALKTIDESLFRNFVDWSKEFLGGLSLCETVWDFFPPVGCDLHGSNRHGPSSLRSIQNKLEGRYEVFASDEKRKFSQDELRKMMKNASDTELKQLVAAIGHPISKKGSAIGDSTYIIRSQDILQFIEGVRCFFFETDHLTGMRTTTSGCRNQTLRCLRQLLLIDDDYEYEHEEAPPCCQAIDYQLHTCKFGHKSQNTMKLVYEAREQAISTLSSMSNKVKPRELRQDSASTRAQRLPPPPVLKLESVGPHHVELKWIPTHQSADEPLYFSLEMTRKSDCFSHVLNDPPAPNLPPQLNTKIVDLAPNTTYRSRIRAVNTQGQGKYAFLDFTTTPRKPTLELVKTTTSSLHIRISCDEESLKRKSPSDTKFSVEIYKVADDVSGEFKTISGCSEDTTIHGLDSGSAFRLRCFAVNDDGQISPASDSSYVHTLAQFNTPVKSIYGSDFVRISFEEPVTTNYVNEFDQWANQATNSVIREFFKQVVQEENPPSGSDDANDMPQIPVRLLPPLMTNLGVKPLPVRLDSLSTFQIGGMLSVTDIENWWRRNDPLCFIIKRQRGDESITCYMGPHKSDGVVVQNLEPNTKYTFRIRFVSARSTSCWNANEIQVTTLPTKPPRPALVEVQESSCWLKICGFKEREKFLVEQNVENKPQWTTVYEGSNCLVRIMNLKGGGLFKFRVRAVNTASEAGNPSEVLTMTLTAAKMENAFEFLKLFCINCKVGDVVVGDSILFDEFVTTDIAQESDAGKRERTIAARVNAISNNCCRMEVLFCHARYNEDSIKAGSLIERDVSDTFSEMVLRKKWAEEDRR